jgi:hypothetical protein
MKKPKSYSFILCDKHILARQRRRRYTLNMKKILYIFVFSFLLNFVWENLHALLYAGYQGGKITEFILFRASLGDAVMITVLALPFLFIAWFQKRSWLMIVIGIVLAILIEWYALGAGRWAYNEYMPIIPFLGTGLTPTIQLGLLGYLSYWAAVRREKNI